MPSQNLKLLKTRKDNQRESLSPDRSTAPFARTRRLRKTQGLRELVQETRLHQSDFILPLFVEENLEERTPISSLSGQYRETEKSLSATVQSAYKQGARAIMLFGVSHNKDFEGSDSFSREGLLTRMIKRAKDACPEMIVIADACFCEYTDHGHCGPVDETGDVDNDRTLENLALQSLAAAEAGADIIAPSGMMDGMVYTIRSALDSANHKELPILSYSAKFASNYYGPFRDAAGCSLEGGSHNFRKDRKTYQMNPANSDEALQEVAIDLEEGADMIMVKPGLPYLDVIRRIKESFDAPLFAYHVSGEYAMLKAAAEKGWLDYNSTLMETMLAFKRAGCTAMLTYAALDCIKIIREDH